MTVGTSVAGGAMGWQERLWEALQRAGDWPRRTLEIVCLMTALPFYLGALVYRYFPFFGLGAAFTALAWLVEEKRRGDDLRLVASAWALLRRCLARPHWTAVAAILLGVGVWREAIWVALVGVVALRMAVRRGRPSVPQPDRGQDAEL